jgi:hypothetical protein
MFSGGMIILWSWALRLHAMSAAGVKEKGTQFKLGGAMRI